MTREHCGPLHRLDVRVEEGGEHGLLVAFFVDGMEEPVAERVAAMDFEPENGETVLALFDHDENAGTVVLEAGRPVRVEVELVFPPDFIHLVAFGCNPPLPDDVIGRAVAAAEAADLAIVVVGTNEEGGGRVDGP